MKSLAVAAAVVFVVAGAPALAQDTIHKAGQPGVTNPVVVSDKRPSYTPEAMRARIQGYVYMQAVIDESGKPTQIKVTRSLDPGLDQEAVDALGQWAFKPAMKDGKPVKCQVMIEMSFTLRSGPVFDKTHTDVTAPVAVFIRKPAYTADAVRAKIEGDVELEGIVGLDGKVSEVRVVKSLSPELDAKAIEAFKASTFKPAVRNGRDVLYRAALSFSFHLRN